MLATCSLTPNITYCLSQDAVKVTVRTRDGGLCGSIKFKSKTFKILHAIYQPIFRTLKKLGSTRKEIQCIALERSEVIRSEYIA